jgi:biotin synthase-like enzyme
MLISGGTPLKKDETYLDEVYEYVINKCPLPVDVMMAPRENAGILHRLHDWGCKGLSINLEIEDEESAKKFIPEKYRIGRQKYLEFIEKAVAIFGRGKVRSCIILGLEDEESTLKGVERLAEIGCDPVLSPFKPLKGTILENVLPPGASFQKSVYERAEKIAKQYGVLLGPRCIPCQHNTLTFPLETKGYFFY